MTTYEGGCGCGKIRFKYTQTEETMPVFNAFCHCKNCRTLLSSSAPHVVAVPTTSLEWSGDEPKVYNVTKKFKRSFCGNCGCGVSQVPAGVPFTALFPATFDVMKNEPNKKPEVPEWLLPTFHMNIENSILAEHFESHGLPMFLNLPEPFGGDGKMHTPKTAAK